MRLYFREVLGVFAVLMLQGCLTSGDIVAGKRLKDPADVKTLDNPNLRASSGAEEARRQVDILQGQLEDQRVAFDHERTQNQTRISQLEKQVEELVAELTKVRTAKPGKESGSGASSGGAKSGVDGIWSLAVKDLKSAQYDSALGLFQEILANYPKDLRGFETLASVGMIQYHNRQFKEAAISFSKIVDRMPKHPRVAMAWFGQGASFLSMGQREDGALFLEEVINSHPKSPEAKWAKALLKPKAKVPQDLFTQYPEWIKSLKQ